MDNKVIKIYTGVLLFKKSSKSKSVSITKMKISRNVYDVYAQFSPSSRYLHHSVRITLSILFENFGHSFSSIKLASFRLNITLLLFFERTSRVRQVVNPAPLKTEHMI